MRAPKFPGPEWRKVGTIGATPVYRWGNEYRDAKGLTVLPKSTEPARKPAKAPRKGVPAGQESPKAPKTPQRSKFGNQAVDGFDSKREARRWGELAMLEKVGHIRNLRRQVPYVLIPAQYIDGKCVERACTWTADFVYEDGREVMTNPSWTLVVEDAKGFPNDRWPIKRKLMLHVHGVRVREV